jgi:hypothetical protein
MNITHIRNVPANDLKLVSFIVVDYNTWMTCNWRYDAKHDVLDQEAWSRYENRQSNGFSYKCDCCGHTLIYACVIEHVPTGEFFHVGRDCFANIECLKQHRDWVSFTGDRAAVRVSAGKKAAKERKAGDVREHQFFLAHPEMVAVFDFAVNPPISREDNSFNAISWAVSTIGDMRQSIRRYGKLSDKQFSFAQKLYTESLEKIERARVRAQEVAQAVASGVRAPEGRVQVEGTIVSLKLVQNDFSYYGGAITKALIDLGNGTRAWGTLPSSSNSEKGNKVRFTATFTVSDKDPLFAFYKRPSKWEELAA